jgi:hypothetical protein
MAEPKRIPAGHFTDDPTWLQSVRPEDLVYFLLNVGDGDAQVIVLPEVKEHPNDPKGIRRAIVVDAALVGKVPDLLRKVAGTGLLERGPDGADGAPTLGPTSIALVVGTHPHQDHIGGLAQVLTEFAGSISEFWDPGYFHTIPAYHTLMRAVENQPDLLYAQPTSGLRRWISDVLITVLSPSIELRNRYDTYGVEINDSSISFRLEWPASRVVKDPSGRRVVTPKTSSLILGADAQTLSWSYVLVDFPYLAQSKSDVAKALKAATGSDPLRSTVLKVSHHCSKHGVNLELVERIHPSFTLVSSVGVGGSYGFPHTVAQELIREALNPSTVSGAPHPDDYELGIFYTADEEDAQPQPVPLGSMALVIGKGAPEMYRFGDSPTAFLDLESARKWSRKEL